MPVGTILNILKFHNANTKVLINQPHVSHYSFNSSKTNIFPSSSPERARILMTIRHQTIAFNTRISREALFHSLLGIYLSRDCFLESKSQKSMSVMPLKAS